MSGLMRPSNEGPRALKNATCGMMQQGPHS
jgi:hypothetical protein